MEGYGTTECDGIALEGYVLPRVRGSLRVKDSATGEWVRPDDYNGNKVVGELWVGDHNTKDIVSGVMMELASILLDAQKKLPLLRC